MNFKDFQTSLNKQSPPDGVSELLMALWHDANGDWNQAHEIAQEVDGALANWVHAYLHRKEGDSSNAGYWYQRAGKNYPDINLNEEWEVLVKALI